MKNINGNYLTLTFTLALALIALADDRHNFKYSDWQAVITDNWDGCCITRYVGTNTIVHVPNSINGWPVVEIGTGAFSRSHQITEVKLGNNLQIIGDYAFFTCVNLKEIDIPDSVTHIGYGAFWVCWGLESVIVGNGVETIDDGAFYEDHLRWMEFKGDAPVLGWLVFGGDEYIPLPDAVIYYHPQTSGWANTFGGLPTVPWTERNEN